MNNTHKRFCRKTLFVMSILFLVFSVLAFNFIFFPLFNNGLKASGENLAYNAGFRFIDVLYVFATFAVVVLINFIGHTRTINQDKAVNAGLTISLSLIGISLAYAFSLSYDSLLSIGDKKSSSPNSILSAAGLIYLLLLVFSLIVIFVLKNVVLKHKLYSCKSFVGMLKDVVIFLMICGLTYFLVTNMRGADKNVLLTARVNQLTQGVVYVRFIIYILGLALLSMIAYTNSFKADKEVKVAFYVLFTLFVLGVIFYLATMMNYDKKLRNGEEIITLVVSVLFFASSALALCKSTFKYPRLVLVKEELK